MSKRDVGTPPRPASNYYPICKYYILWIVAATLSLVAIKNILFPKQSQTSSSNLQNFRSLSSFSPIADSFSADTDDLRLGVSNPYERAVVTTLYSESFASGVLALGHSLRAVNTSARRVVLYYPDQLTIRTMCYLQSNGWELHPVPHRSGDEDANLKFQPWALNKVGIKNVVYLESDTLVRRNFDELWSLPFVLAGVPQAVAEERSFWQRVDTGVLFLRTSSATYKDMLDKFDVLRKTRAVGFEEFLNKYFAAQIAQLPYIYNADIAIKRSGPGLWLALTNHVRIIRYTVAKPFFEEERRQAVEGIWEKEMEWWESAWQETFKELEGKC